MGTAVGTTLAAGGVGASAYVFEPACDRPDIDETGANRASKCDLYHVQRGMPPIRVPVNVLIRGAADVPAL